MYRCCGWVPPPVSFSRESDHEDSCNITLGAFLSGFAGKDCGRVEIQWPGLLYNNFRLGWVGVHTVDPTLPLGLPRVALRMLIGILQRKLNNTQSLIL